MSGMLACLKPHPLGCARIPEHKKIHWIFCAENSSERIFLHPKNKCLSQTTPFKVWWHIVFLILNFKLINCNINNNFGSTQNFEMNLE